MEMNYNNYIDLDEQEMQQDEEQQIKEIQALLINELDGIELDENDDNDDDDDEEEENSICDKSETEENMTFRTSFDEEELSYEVKASENANSNNNNSNNSSSNDKENKSLSQPFHMISNYVPNWAMAPTAYGPYYNAMAATTNTNFQYKFPTINANCNGINDASINWEISLHDEMGVPGSGNCQAIFTNKQEYLPPSNTESQSFIPLSEKPLNRLKITTRDVAIECIPATQRELDNLELLYAARGKRIEQLQLELDAEREKRIKESRISNHKITLLESEQKNETNLTKRVKEECEQQRRIIISNEETINKQNTEIEHLEGNINELKENLESCNIVIEGLNGQLSDLTTSTGLSRTNQKQADLLDCINRQFDTDSYRLKAEIQRMSERVDEKIKEIEKLEALMDEQTENHRLQKLEWKTERDKLLEELAREREYCKELESSTNQEKIDQLNNQIADLNLGKSLAEDMNDYLHQNVLELSYQLAAFEQSLNLLDKTQVTNSSFCLGESQEKDGDKSKLSGSCPLLPIVDGKQIIADHTCEMRKQIFVLVARTNSLTNRLLEVRKANLDSKGQLRKLHKTLEDQDATKSVLQGKLVEMEKRFKEIQSGDETSFEKQLRASLESTEIVKDCLEQQCKVLQNQLKQATDYMKESDKNYVQLEEEFSVYKKMAEEDKMSSIEDVKRVCNNHYDNLRQQLEQSWMNEKELLMSEEKCHREKLVQDLSDAVKEVDRVKNLYIQLSQQKSNEDLDRNNWHEWLTKKLDEQKRSLNQQFKKDQEIVINNLKINYQLEIERLQSEVAISTTISSTCREDKCEGTVPRDLIDRICSADSVDMCERYVQVDSIVDHSDRIKALIGANEQLQMDLESGQEEYTKLQKEYDLLHNAKLSIEQENISLSSKTGAHESSPPMSPDSRCSLLSNEISDHCGSIPNIIRSTTPQLVFNTKRKNGQALARSSNLRQQFKVLKQDLISKLSEISHSAQLDNKISHQNWLQKEQLSCEDFPSGMTMENMKEQLYSFVLEAQIRATSTLQHELEKSQVYVRQSLLQQLRQIIPIIVTVDGQMMNISPDKIKKLVDKIVLTLDQLQIMTSSKSIPRDTTTLQSNPTSPFSLTSTPRKCSPPSNARSNIPPNISNVSLNTSNDSSTSSLKSNSAEKRRYHHVIDSQCQQLKDEIAQLSEVLHQSANHSCASSTGDGHWLCRHTDYSPSHCHMHHHQHHHHSNGDTHTARQSIVVNAHTGNHNN